MAPPHLRGDRLHDKSDFCTVENNWLNVVLFFCLPEPCICNTRFVLLNASIGPPGGKPPGVNDQIEGVNW